MSAVIGEASSQGNGDAKTHITNLQELMQSNVDTVLMDAICLAGRLILQHDVLDPEFCAVFEEFTRRLFSNSKEHLTFDMYFDHSMKINCDEVLAVVEMWLEDVSYDVRQSTVMTLCEFAKANLSSFPQRLLEKAVDTFHNVEFFSSWHIICGLWDVYHAYCEAYSDGLIELCDRYEQIAYRTIVYFMELTGCQHNSDFSLDCVITSMLFPSSICAEDRADHWAYFFRFFSPSQRLNLECYLSDKHRFQLEAKEFLHSVVQKGPAESIQSCTNSSIRQFFQTFYKMDDSRLIQSLHLLIDEQSTIESSQSAREALMGMIVPGDPSYTYLGYQILKCSYSIFTRDYVRRLLFLLNGDAQSVVDPDNALELLNMIAKVLPVLVEGYEKDLDKALYNHPYK